MIAVVVMAWSIAAQCTGSACPTPCTACAFQPVSGTNPSRAAWLDLFERVAERNVAADLPPIQTIESGPNRTRTASSFPCRLLPAIAMTESGVAQFCPDSGKTVISFDCGFGVMQVTSGAAKFPGLQSRADINVVAGADILAAKWNGDQSFGGHFGNSDPAFVESWYFATWAYNGFVYGNNPSNPDHRAGRAPFRSPATSPRRDYPYQELVWGYLQFPQDVDGGALVVSATPTYPPVCAGTVAACCVNNVCRGIPNQSGLFNVTLPVPQPAHIDPCTPSCPPSGCPAANQREVFVDDEDDSFALFGDISAVTVNGEGGFRGVFRSVAPLSSSIVTARWVGFAPSSGTFNVSGFVPLSPASHPRVNVVVTSRGGASRFALDQSGEGGAFLPLGDVVLLRGQPFTIEVSNDNGGVNGLDAERIGLDAFALTWRGDGAVDVGGVCATSVVCENDAICVDGRCAPGCETAGCGASEGCQRATGLCVAVAPAEGEGEGEGEDPVFPVEGEGEGNQPLPSTTPLGSSVNRGCICAVNDDGGVDISLLAVLLAMSGRRRRS